MRTRGGIVAAIVAALLASVSLTGCYGVACSLAPLTVDLNPAILHPGQDSTVSVANAWSGCDNRGHPQPRTAPVIVQVLAPQTLDVIATVSIPIAGDGTGTGTLAIGADVKPGDYRITVDGGDLLTLDAVLQRTVTVAAP